MIYKSAEAGQQPEKVTLEHLPERTIVRLTDNVTKFRTDEDQAQEMYRYDEVDFDLPDDCAEETEETIADNFAAWWEFGQEEQGDEEITLEDRIAALEEMYMMAMEG